MSTADRDDLAAILAKHRIEEMSTWRKQWRCTCGEKIGKSEEPAFLLRSTHRAHVAQMVLESDWLRDVKADVFKRGWIDSAVHHATCHECGTGPLRHEIPDKYRADRVDTQDNTTDRTQTIDK